MKKCSYFLILFILFVSCEEDKISGGGQTITETRTISGFSEVTVSGSTDVYITQGSDFEIKVKAYSNLLPYLETKIENDEMLIAYKSNSNVQNDNSEVYITMPELNSLSTSGSGTINTTGNFIADDFNASVSGSGNISIEEGTANSFAIDISGSGNIKSFGLKTKKAYIAIKGSGNAEVYVIEELKAKIKGSGNIYYMGTPAIIDPQISGSGALIKQ